MASRSSSKAAQSADPTQAIVAAVLAALQGQTAEAPKATRTTKATKATKATDYDLSKSATRSQVFRAFFAMAKAHHGLTFKSDEWPTSGDIQEILDALK